MARSNIKHQEQTSQEAQLQTKKHWWLLSDYDDDVWHLKQDKHSAPSSFTVNWDIDLSKNIDSLGKWKLWKEYGKTIVVAIMESDLTEVNKPITLASYAREVRHLLGWFCFQHGLHQISGVTKDHVPLYEAHISAKKVSVNTVLTKLHIFNLLWRLKDEVGTGLTFLPYHNGKLKPRAKRLGVPNKRTPTIPPNQFFQLLDATLGIVENTHSWLGKLDTYLNLKKQYGKNVSSYYKAYYDESPLILFDRIRLIYVASIVVILSFTAMRKHEATVLSYGNALSSLEDGKDLEGVEHKTSKTLTGKSTKRPIPQEAKKALENILSITNHTRKRFDDDEKLLRMLPFQHSYNNLGEKLDFVTSRVLYGLFDKLTDELNIGYKLRPHMLRRAFSMLWAWRFEVGDLEHLSRFLNHNNYLFTKMYVDDPDIYEFLPEEMQKYTAKVFENAFNGEKDIKGGFSNRIAKYKKLISSKIKVLEPSVIPMFVDTVMDKVGYEVIPNADGYCFMSKGRARHAKCSTDGESPNYSNRNEKYCSSCPNFGVTESHIGYWEKRKKAHENVRKSATDKLLKDAAIVGVERSDRIIAMFKEVN